MSHPRTLSFISHGPRPLPPPPPIQQQQPQQQRQQQNEEEEEDTTYVLSKSWRTSHGQLVLRLQRFLSEKVFVRLFLGVESYPCWCVVGIILLSLSLSVAAFLTGSVRVVTNVEETAVPSSSYTLAQKEWVRHTYRQSAEPTSILIHDATTTTQGGSNVLRQEAIEMAWDMEELIVKADGLPLLCPHLYAELTDATMSHNAAKTAFTTMGDDLCDYQSVTRFWNDRAHYETELSALDGSHHQQQQQQQQQQQRGGGGSNDLRDFFLQTQLSRNFFADGQPVVRELLFGGFKLVDKSLLSNFVTSEDTSVLLESAQYLFSRVIMPTRNEGNNNDNKRDTTDFQKERQKFESSLARLVKDYLQNKQTTSTSSTMTTVSVHLHNQMQPEFVDIQDPILSDVPLIGVSIVIMSLFSALSLTRWRRNTRGQRCVNSNFLLGLGAAVTVILSTLTGYAFCSFCGCPVTVLTKILPFILLGIGLDDAFIIVGAYYHTDPSMSLRARLVAMTYLAIPSITSTTLTDCFAFALAAFSNVPGIRWFCFYAVICILIGYFYQVTFFMALLVLDHKRREFNRYDCLICVQATRGRGTVVQQESSSGDDMEEGEVIDLDRDATATPSGMTIRELRTTPGLLQAYGRLVVHPAFKIIVLVLFGLAFAGGVYAATRATIDIEITKWTPVRSHYQTNQFSAIHRDYILPRDMMTTTTGFVCHLYYDGLDFTDESVRAQMRTFRNQVLQLGNDNRLGFGQNYWMNDFNQHRLLPENQNKTVAENLVGFLRDGRYSMYIPDFVLDESNHVVGMREQVILSSEPTTTVSRINFLRNQRLLALSQPLNQGIQGNDSGRMFLFAPEFPEWAHYEVLANELMVAIVVGVVAVGLISLFFVPHWTGTLLSVMVITAVDIELVGVIYLLGLSINTTTLVLLVTSITLVSGYCLRTVHTYLHVDADSRNDRVRVTVEGSGGSVFLSGTSIFLGVLALAFAEGEVLRTFFIMFVSMVMLGMIHALAFLPVALSFVGPGVMVTKARVQEKRGEDAVSVSASLLLLSRSVDPSSSLMSTKFAQRKKKLSPPPMQILISDTDTDPVWEDESLSTASLIYL